MFYNQENNENPLKKAKKRTQNKTTLVIFTKKL